MLSPFSTLTMAGQITKQALDPLLRELAMGGKNVTGLIEKLKLRKLSSAELKALILKEKSKSKEEVIRAIMSKHRLVVDGADLNNALSKTAK